MSKFHALAFAIPDEPVNREHFWSEWISFDKQSDAENWCIRYFDNYKVTGYYVIEEMRNKWKIIKGIGTQYTDVYYDDGQFHVRYFTDNLRFGTLSDLKELIDEKISVHGPDSLVASAIFAREDSKRVKSAKFNKSDKVRLLSEVVPDKEWIYMVE